MVAEHPVVACYRGPDSAGALQLAAVLATALGQPLALAVAYDYEPVALSARAVPEVSDERRAQAAADAVQRAHRLVGEAHDVREHVVPAADDVADALCDLARDLDAGVLVLGRDVAGHVVRDVVSRARCPVAVSPFDLAVPGLQQLADIAVADDGSPPAALARLAAERLAEAAGGTVTTLTAAPGRDAAAELIAASATHDLIACGSRGRGRLAAAVLGSVSSELLHAARCPVLVVPSGVGPAPQAPLGLATAAHV